MCNFITKGSSNNFGHFFMKTAFDVKIFKLQERRALFPIASHFADAHVYNMTHCVSEFRDYVSEGGPDTYPIFGDVSALSVGGAGICKMAGSPPLKKFLHTPLLLTPIGLRCGGVVMSRLSELTSSVIRRVVLGHGYYTKIHTILWLIARSKM